MKIMVTGGAGFIGSNLCSSLVKEGNTVFVLDNLSVGDSNVNFLEKLGVSVLVKDITDYRNIKDDFKGIDVVIHLAAMNRAQRSIEDPLGANQVNIEGTLNVLEASRQTAVKRFVNISSSSVYADQRDILLEEDMPLSPPHPYGVGKLAGEHYARIYNEIYGLPTVTLRFFSVYGPRQLGMIDKAGVVAKFIHQAMNDQILEVYGNGRQMRNFSYVDDVVEYIKRAMTYEDAIGEIINVANSREISVNYLAETVRKVTGKDIKIEHINPLRGDPNRNPADTKKAITLLNYESKSSFEDGIRATLHWYKKEQNIS